MFKKVMQAVKSTVGAATLLVLVTCGGGPTTPSPAVIQQSLPVTMTTTHYVFRYADGDSVQSERQERYHDWAIARLGLTLDRPIAYHKYRDRAHMKAVTGKETNGWADPATYAIHSIWPWDNHEVVHVMTALIGRPTDFFNEGIAVSMQMDPQTGRLEAYWSSRAVHDWAHAFRWNRELPRLADMVETNAFRRLDDVKSYPMAGSFVAFLIEERGMDRVKNFFTTGSRTASVADIERQFSAAFGMTLQESETRWHGYLDARYGAR